MPHDYTAYREVIAYSRFSTPEQAAGASTARQSDAATRWATEHGITLSSRSCLDSGLSGYHGDHLSSGAFGRLLDGLRGGTIPTPALLLVEAADRFGRLPSITTLQLLFGRLFDHGCDLLLLDRGLLVTADRFNADLGLQVSLLAELHAAHAYSTRLSARLLDAHQRGREAIAAGQAVRTGWAPRWITLTPDGTWVLNEYAGTVLRLVELLEAGHGQTITAQRLTAEGHRTPRGRAWTPGTISHIAYSPAIAGGRILQRRTGAVVWGYWPAVIERPRREALLQRLAGRDPASGLHGQQGQRLWIGQGLTRCAACGRPVGVRTASCLVEGVKVKHVYVRCRGRIDGKCDQPAIRLQAAQAALLTRLRLDSLQGLFPSSTTDPEPLQTKAAALMVEVREAKAMLAVLEHELERAAATEPAIVPVLARQVVKAEGRIEQLEQQHQLAVHAVEAAASDRLSEAAGELAGQVEALWGAFARGEDTVADRKALHLQLQALDLRICLDAGGERLGLSIGPEGLVEWQPLTGLALGELAAGRTDRRYGQLQEGDIHRDEAGGLWLQLQGADGPQWALVEDVSTTGA